MALISIEQLTEHTRMGVWKIEDTVEAILAEDSQLHDVLQLVDVYHSDVRRKETLAVYALLFAMTHDASLRIEHDELSRPLVKGYRVSISHTRGYAALILSTKEAVAVDIEYMSNRVERIASKFVRADEKALDVASKLIHWSVKETIYKLFAFEKLEMFDIRLHPFSVNPDGLVKVDDLKISKTQWVKYRINDQYVLTYTYL